MVSYRDATFCVAQLWRDLSVRGKTQTRGRINVAIRCERAHFRLWSASWCRHTAAPLTGPCVETPRSTAMCTLRVTMQRKYNGVKTIAVIFTCLQYLTVCDKPKTNEMRNTSYESSGAFLDLPVICRKNSNFQQCSREFSVNTFPKAGLRCIFYSSISKII